MQPELRDSVGMKGENMRKDATLRSLLLCGALLALALGLTWPARGDIIQVTDFCDYNTGITFWTDRSSIDSFGWRLAFESSAEQRWWSPHEPGHVDVCNLWNLEHNFEIWEGTTGGTWPHWMTWTFTGAGAFGNVAPDVSGNGEMLAYSSDADPRGWNPDHEFRVFIRGYDSGPPVQLTQGPNRGSYFPSINRDGTLVAFVSRDDLDEGKNTDGSLQLFVANSDGTALKQLTDCGHESVAEEAPSIAGHLVAFASNADLEEGRNTDHSVEIFVVNTDGTGPKQLTDGGMSHCLSPSIDAFGDRVAFTSNADLEQGRNTDHSWEIFVVYTDGSGLKQLTDCSDHQYDSTAPEISANGLTIAYMSNANPDGWNNTDHSMEIFAVGFDGAGPWQLTHCDDPSYSSWAPSIDGDGDRVTFTSDADLAVINSNHFQQIFLARGEPRVAQYVKMHLSWSLKDLVPHLPRMMSPGHWWDADVGAQNTGTDSWSDKYGLVSVEGPTDAARPVDRWGVSYLPIETGTAVESGSQYTFHFTGDHAIVAPPSITLKYIPAAAPSRGSPLGSGETAAATGFAPAITPTQPPAVGSFQCGWMMSPLGCGTIGPDIATSDVTIQRPVFTDVPADFWAWAEIQQCANAATAASDFIVHGYGDGSYQPAWTVTRGMMAVFVARAAGYTDEAPETATFPDVPTTYWSFREVEACVANGVVQGYPDGLYRPATEVTRDQMAVYIRRAAELPTAPYMGQFSDVPDDFWAASDIQACVDASIVKGYPDGLYRPSKPVTRDQMAVFIWRGLVMPSGSVVIAGPAAARFGGITPSGGPGEAELFLPGALSYYGWTSSDVAPGALVYIGLDAMRQASGDITFKVSHVEGEGVTTIDDDATVTVDQAVSMAAVESSGGNPYLIASYQVPPAADLGADEYPETYTVTVELPNGAVLTIGEFEVAAAP
jgi:Tol biopolymer transport system component